MDLGSEDRVEHPHDLPGRPLVAGAVAAVLPSTLHIDALAAGSLRCPMCSSPEVQWYFCLASQPLHRIEEPLVRSE